MADPAKKDDALAIAVRDAFQRHMEQARQASLAAKAAPPTPKTPARSQAAPVSAPEDAEGVANTTERPDGASPARTRLEPPPAVNDLPSWLDRRNEPQAKPAAATDAPRPFVRPLDEEWAAKPKVDPALAARQNPVNAPPSPSRKLPPMAPSRIDAALRVSRTAASPEDQDTVDTDSRLPSFGGGAFQPLRADPPLQLPRDIPPPASARRRRALDTSAEALALPPIERNRQRNAGATGKSSLGLMLIAGAALLLCAAIAAAVIFRGPIGDLRPAAAPAPVSAVPSPSSAPSVAAQTDTTVASTAEAPSLTTRPVKVLPIRLDDVDIAVQTAREHIAAGEVAHARLMLAGLQGTGDARVLMTMGESFDPAITPDPATADVKQAIRFYEAAEKAGNAVAAERVARLAATAN